MNQQTALVTVPEYQPSIRAEWNEWVIDVTFIETRKKGQSRFTHNQIGDPFGIVALGSKGPDGELVHRVIIGHVDLMTHCPCCQTMMQMGSVNLSKPEGIAHNLWSIMEMRRIAPPEKLRELVHEALRPYSPSVLKMLHCEPHP